MIVTFDLQLYPAMRRLVEAWAQAHLVVIKAKGRRLTWMWVKPV
jgi:hypothetical protein